MAANDKGQVHEFSDDADDVSYLGEFSDDSDSVYAEQGLYPWSYDVEVTTREEQDAIAKKRSKEWMASVDSKHKKAAKAWQSQNGMMKIVPVFQIQKFSSTLITHIMDKIPEPQTQVVPISNVSVTPHNISFNFFDTSEGKIGVSNAVENHMVVECDIYVTDLVYYWWRHESGKDKGFGYKQDVDISELKFSNKKPKKLKHTDKIYTSMTKKQCAKLDEKISKHDDFEQTKKFADFRGTFLMYYTGWRLYLISHLFPAFYGSITDIKYDISEGESLAKWHIKIEEALFYDAGRDGKKPESTDSKTSQGDSSGSGNAGTDASSDGGNGEGTEGQQE